MTNASPLSTAKPWDLVAAEYAEVTVPLFRHFAEEALRLASLRPGAPIVDVAAGPGTLALLAAAQGAKVVAVDFAPAMIAALKAAAKVEGVSVEALVGDGMALPLGTERFAAAFSLFGVIFFPDRLRGLRELCRVVEPGGVVVISSWQPMERFPMLSDMFATLAELLPEMPFGRGAAPLGDEAEIVQALTLAGFESIVVQEVSKTTHFPSLGEAFTALYRGSAPLALLCESMGEPAWSELLARMLEKLAEKYGIGEQDLTMTAYLAVAKKPLD
jgi:ubiquinone/menaquinone biosynthesis C-methylase UbiE